MFNMLGVGKDSGSLGRKPLISIAIVLPEDISHPIGTESSKIRHNGEVLEGDLDVIIDRPMEFQATVRFEGWFPQMLKNQFIDVLQEPRGYGSDQIISEPRTHQSQRASIRCVSKCVILLPS
jgi:hypothetical protein